MAEQSPSAPAQVLQKIEYGSHRVKELATELSSRVIAFEEWLNHLPGKVETTCWEQWPKDSTVETVFGLCLGRSGKSWVLKYDFLRPQYDDPSDLSWTPLTEASVEIKLFALKQFPKLLEAIVKAQEKVVREIEEAHFGFDAFADAIGLPKRKEGK